MLDLQHYHFKSGMLDLQHCHFQSGMLDLQHFHLDLYLINNDEDIKLSLIIRTFLHCFCSLLQHNFASHYLKKSIFSLKDIS